MQRPASFSGWKVAVGVKKEPTFDHGSDGLRVDRRRQIKDDIAHRIRNACSHLSEEDFRQLVEAMTDRQLRGEFRAGKFY